MNDAPRDDAPPILPSPARRVGRAIKTVAQTLAVATALLLLVGWLRAPALPDAPPPLRLTSLTGDEVDLADLRGRPVVVNFWATWCGPCRLELPLLRGHDGPDSPVLFVSVDGDRGPLTAFARAHGLPPERVLLGDAATSRAWGVSTLPTSVAIDRDGRVRAVHAGIVTPPQLWWWRW